MTVFSMVEVVLGLLGVVVIFTVHELRFAGKVLRGGGVAAVGILLLMPLPFGVAIGFYSGEVHDFALQARSGKSMDAVYAEAVEKLWWLDPAGIALSGALIGMTFLLCGKTQVRADGENCLARDGWRDPPDWAVQAARHSANPGTGRPPKEAPPSEGITTTPNDPLRARPPQAP